MTVSIYITTMIALITIVVIAAIIAPMGARINTEFYAAGEQIFLDANESLQGIQDENVKARLQATFDAAFAAQENNIEVNANIFQYGWVYAIIITGIIAFLLSRQLVETRGGFV